MNELIDPTQPAVPKTPQQIALERYEGWDLPKKTDKEKVQWFQSQVIPYIASVLLNGDRIHECITTDDLLPNLKLALLDPELDANWLEEALKRAPQWDEASLFQVISNLPTRSTKADEMLVENPESMNEAQQFVRIVAHSALVRLQLQTWDREIGYTAFLKSRGSLVVPSYEELRQVFFTHMFFEHMQARSSQLASATMNADAEFGLPSMPSKGRR